MSSRSAKLVKAALRNAGSVDEQFSVPSTSDIQNSLQESSEEVWSDFDFDDSVLDKDTQEIQHKTVLETPEHSDGEIILMTKSSYLF
ncbi:hypothetical protein HF086_015747 [Spodoptera exigua]|uniref:Uncharacterized protein n=1 Tax=Spodoptera exigua TaxID=7107 RepID=A0A922ML49_SPOEX|nr:hypothetical protein HF086_015747 [Spodoptera exigua]